MLSKLGLLSLIIIILNISYELTVNGHFIMTEYRSEQMKGEIQVVNETTNYQHFHPGANLTEMTKMKSVKGQLKYTMGKRITGDSLVAEKADEQSFPSAQYVQVVLRYPLEGTGKTVTYVNVVVDQSSTLGNGYIVEGGIEQNFIKVLIEANSTLHFSYSASIYGY